MNKACIVLLGWLAFATARAEEEPWRARDLVTDASGQVWGILGRPSIFNRAHDDEAFREIGAFNPAYSQWDIHPYLGAPSDSLPQRLGRLARGVHRARRSLRRDRTRAFGLYALRLRGEGGGRCGHAVEYAGE